MGAIQRLGQALIRRALSTSTDDLFQCTDETGTVITSINHTGKIEATSGLDIGAAFGAVEIALLSATGQAFQLWNPGDGRYHFKSFSESFNVPGSNYTNGSVNVVPLQIRGLKTTTGAPTTGTWVTNDTIMDSAKTWWLCTAGGSPGTWV